MILVIMLAITFFVLPWWIFWPGWAVLTLAYLKGKDYYEAERIKGLSSEELVQELRKQE